MEEIEASQTLQIAMWLLLLGWYLQFAQWVRFSDFTINAVEAGRHLCWPFFQGCGDWYFLSSFPHVNTHGLFFAVLLGLLGLVSFFLIRRSYTYAHMVMLFFFVFEIAVLLLSMRLAINYWYYHALMAALFLLPAAKLTLMRFGVVLLYFLAGTLKLDDGWLQGNYFKALSEGLYFVPDTLIPLATNGVIVMQLFFVWFLLSPNKTYRYTALAIFSLFHLYSSLYVGYLFPTVTFAMVLVLFISNEKRVPIRELLRRGKRGPAILLLVIAISLIQYVIPGDARITGEGNRLGMYMFEANYQCSSRMVVYGREGEILSEDTSETFSSNQRCDPYAHFFYFKQLCAQDSNIQRIAWTLDTSINGGDFMRIVDEEDACALEYRPLQHNAWIKTPEFDEVEIIKPAQPNRYLRMGGSLPGGVR